MAVLKRRLQHPPSRLDRLVKHPQLLRAGLAIGFFVEITFGLKSEPGRLIDDIRQDLLRKRLIPSTPCILHVLSFPADP